MTQKKQVLNHLINKGSLTSLEAVQHYHIMRLSERIRELKSDGWLITKTEHKSESAKDISGCVGNYARYHFDKAQLSEV
jgi:hypothetical protein